MIQRIGDFGFMVENGRLRRCDPWGDSALIRVEVFRVRDRTGIISFKDPQRRVSEQRVMIKGIGDSGWKSWGMDSMNNKTICNGSGLEAAVNKSAEYLLREIAEELVACDK